MLDIAPVFPSGCSYLPLQRNASHSQYPSHRLATLYCPVCRRPLTRREAGLSTLMLQRQLLRRQWLLSPQLHRSETCAIKSSSLCDSDLTGDFLDKPAERSPISIHWRNGITAEVLSVGKQWAKLPLRCAASWMAPLQFNHFTRTCEQLAYAFLRRR